MDGFSAQHEIVDLDRQLPVSFNIYQKCHYMATHWHEYVEIVFQISGGMAAVVQGGFYELSPGDLLIVNENELHRTKSLSGQAPYILIQIPVQYLREIIPSFDTVRFQNYIPARELSAAAPLGDALLRMREAFREKEDGWTLRFLEGLYGMLYLLYKDFSCRMKPDCRQEGGRDLQRMIDLMGWIQSNYQRKLTLMDAADYLCVSKEHFCRIFRKYTGQTFLKYLNCFRAARLYEDLYSSDASLASIMEKNGITNYKVFSRTFREMYVKTPRQARYGMRCEEKNVDS